MTKTSNNIQEHIQNSIKVIEYVQFRPRTNVLMSITPPDYAELCKREGTFGCFCDDEYIAFYYENTMYVMPYTLDKEESLRALGFKRVGYFIRYSKLTKNY